MSFTCMLWPLLFFIGISVSLSSSQSGVCYTITSQQRTVVAYNTRSQKHHYSCGSWRLRRRCERYSAVHFTSEKLQTFYMKKSVCCSGFTEVRGRCTRPIMLTPNYGHLFGGTPVLVSGPYFTTTDTITCQFGDFNMTAMYINEGEVLCVSPRLDKIGETPFVVYVVASDGVTSRFDSTFNTVSPDRAHVVDISSQSVMLQPITAATITWDPEDITPSYLPATTNVNIDITLYKQKYTQNEREWKVNWESATVLALSVPVEDREALVFIPPLALNCRLPLHDNTRSVEVGLCPVIVKVSIGENSNSEPISLPDSVGAWSGMMYMESSFPEPNLRAICDRWGDYEMDSSVTGPNLLQQVVPCPPTEAAARNDRAFEEEKKNSLYRTTGYSQKAMVFFHPGVTSCYRQFTPNSDGVGQQCCYRPDGSLLRGEPSGGSIDTMSPKIDYNRHLSDDIIPFIYCCKGQNELTNCNEYYQWRPSGQEAQYRLPVPACIYGDPHIITLDGLKYTFNGKGEFTMIETSDNSFTLQGRMDTILNSDDTPTPGTVFTALVAREEHTNTTVQFNLQENAIRIRVNHMVVNLAGILVLIKDNVTVTDNGNSTISAFFKGGANMEIKVENGIISVMLITLPSSLKGITRGLMGTFNEDTSDDLVPKSEEKAIPSNSSLEDIHNVFGMTWILKSASESLFTYNAGESFAHFYDPNFNPVFKTIFKNADLEDKAREVCGNDEYCLFDIAATKNVEIGMATMRGVENFDNIVVMSAPVMCDPPCVNGACVRNNTCSCSEGYEGDTCDTAVMSMCNTNICQNNGSCVKHVLTVTCDCLEGYIGSFCQDKEPPFYIRLVNGSPRVSDRTLYADFVASMPIKSAECLLIGGGKKIDCTNGNVQYKNVPTGSFVLLIQVTSMSGERTKVKRIVHAGESGDEQFCAVHLINEGVTVNQRSASIFFKGTEVVISYLCRLIGPDITDSDFTPCRSPIRYQYLEVGEYRFQVHPIGCSTRGKKLSLKFEVY